MSETKCRWVASDQARVLRDRHRDVCDDDGCAGCLPCPMDHCRVCGVEHSSDACPECVGEVRDNLAEILRLCAALPVEVRHRGVNGEAMNLLGPSADSEAWHHRRASTLAGRILPADCEARELEDVQAWLDSAESDLHPLWVAGTWQMVYADAFGHDLGTDRITVASAVGYLDRNLTHAAAEPWVPFEDLARDIRRCVTHLERVLHDGEQIDKTRVTCVNEDCPRRPQLERRWSWQEESRDRWTCPSCHRVYEPGEYQKAMARQLVHKGAEKWLPLRDAVSTLIAQGRPERTIRKWLAPPDPDKNDLEGIVGGFCEIGSHRVWVWWPDLWRLHMTTKTRQRGRAA